jgi:hypothetical protein
MKNLIQNKNAIRIDIIAFVKSINSFKITKTIVLLLVALQMLSSCVRSEASGCGAFPYKRSSMIKNIDNNHVKTIVDINQNHQTQKTI